MVTGGGGKEQKSRGVKPGKIGIARVATKRSRMEKKKKYGKNILRGELDLSRERDGEKERERENVFVTSLQQS